MKKQDKSKANYRDNTSGKKNHVLYYLLILLTCFILYGQSISNGFNIDDDYVYENHESVKKGIAGIPEIFKSRYNTRDEQYFGYRPLTIALCAIEVELLGYNANTAHFFNILYYVLCCSLLFHLLKVLLRDKFPEKNVLFFSLLTTLFFAVHAIHTEVVLSIKNREEIVAMILAVLSTLAALKFFESKKFYMLILSIISLAFAFLAKESSVVFVLLIPLMIIFFKTDIKIENGIKFYSEKLGKPDRTEKILIAFLLLFIILFSITNPFITIYREQIRFILHSYDPIINEYVYWLMFVFVYSYLLSRRKKIYRQKVITKRNLIIWGIILFIIPLIVITFSNVLGLLTLLLFLITLIPQTDENIIEINLFRNVPKSVLISILSIVIIAGIVLLVTYLIPKQFLPETNAPVFKWQNPVFEKTSTFWDKLAIALYSLIYYLKLLFIPYPLRFYYGYKMIPEVSIYNPIVLLSVAVHIYLLYVAFKEFNKRSFLSFGILFYFIAIFPFANTFFPLTGVIAERMLFVPSIGFAIAMVDIVFRISKINMNVLLSKSKRNTAILLLGLIILPNFLITLNRNKDWKDRKTLFEHDLKYLENSAKANTLYANLIIAEVYEGIKKNIPIDNFKNQINLSVKHYNRSIEIDSTYSNPWHNLGYLNMLVFKNYKLAEEQFSNCLKNDTTLAPAYLNRGICNYYLGNFKQSIKDLKDYLTKNNNYKNKEKDKAYVFMGKSYFELGDTAKARQYYIKALDNLKMENLSKPVIDDLKTFFLKLKDYNSAIRIADIEISLNPEIDVPYVDKGNYYLLMGDTVNAIAQWEIAFDKYKGNFNIGITLSGYYREQGDIDKANYYYVTAIKNKRN